MRSNDFMLTPPKQSAARGHYRCAATGGVRKRCLEPKPMALKSGQSHSWPDRYRALQAECRRILTERDRAEQERDAWQRRALAAEARTATIEGDLRRYVAACEDRERTRRLVLLRTGRV